MGRHKQIEKRKRFDQFYLENMAELHKGRLERQKFIDQAVKISGYARATVKDMIRAYRESEHHGFLEPYMGKDGMLRMREVPRSRRPEFEE